MYSGMSSSLSQPKEQLISLALQLSKLLKVIRHSDPTAKSKQELLFNKYKENLAQVAKLYCNQMPWSEFQKLIQLFLDQPDLSLEKEEKNIIVRRLIKDFESFFFKKPVLKEFDKPIDKLKSPYTQKQRSVGSQSSKKEKKVIYTRENIREMLIKTEQRRSAAADLKKIINKLNKLGPEILERKIAEALKQ